MNLMKLFKRQVRPCISEHLTKQHAEINQSIEDSGKKLADFIKQAWAELDALELAKK